MSTCLLLHLVYNYVLSRQFSHFISKGVSKNAYVVGKCISARAHPLTTHIPFRDSKLTRLLQESLGGIVVFDILFFKNIVYTFKTGTLHQTALNFSCVKYVLISECSPNTIWESLLIALSVYS